MSETNVVDLFPPPDFSPDFGSGDYGGEDDDEDEDEDVSPPVDPTSTPGKPEKPKKPRYFCAGAKRRDEDTGKPWCDYKAYSKWTSRPDPRRPGYLTSLCPRCRRPFACLPIKKGQVEARRRMLDEASMSKVKPMEYISTGIKEFDYVLGGGVVLERTLLLGAERGAGKTTLLLQACNGFAQNGRKAYFASGEMTRDAVIQYAQRLGIVNPNMGVFGDPQGVNVEEMFEDVLAVGAKFVVLDSIQVAVVNESGKADIGSPAMVKKVINMLSSFAQAKKRAIITIGHLIGTGDYAGGQGLQFLADGLLMMNNKYNGYDDNGKQKDSMVREMTWDGKSRQCDASLRSLMELTAEGMRSPSVDALRRAGLLQ